MKDTRKRQPYGEKAGTCAGCGRVMWRGKTSLPQGEAACRACRRARREGIRPTECAHCRKPFESVLMSSGWRKTCSADCNYARVLSAARAATRREGPCVDCGKPTASTGYPLRCRLCAKARKLAIQRRHDSLRRGAKPSRSYPMTLGELGTRDGWRCHLCGKRVDRTLSWPHLMCGTFDHLVPVADHGSEEPENLALAHLSCNSKRGAGGTVQLALIG